MRRLTLLTAALSVILTPAAQAQAATKMMSALGKTEGQVSIVAWAGYIERGESDKAYDWVTGFEKQTGCKVSVKVAGSSDEMVSLMNQGGYDLVTASGDASLRLVAGGKVQPVNLKLIPSAAQVNPKLQKAPWYTVGGLSYGVPYQWGPNVLMYSTKVFKTAPKSWDVVFKEQTLPDGKSNKGRVQAYYGSIYIADAALYLMKTQSALGIKNPYELNEKQYAAALALLRQQRPLVQRYWNDANAQVQDFTNEGTALSPTWPFQVNTLQANKQAVASTIPTEGATGWADTTMLSTTAKHPNCAYKWMEHSLSPRVQGDVAAWFGSVPAVLAACKGNALLTDSGCKTNGNDDFDRIWFWRTPVTKCATQGSCVPYGRWVSDYIAIQGGK
ncbi:ABC transporter substrate-binding protein [Deinococcus sp.]|uniref:ABC transporter substrate-binding protein n=1 Tax=Deinococcus sp. TaxID=47478 RepID=UPI002869D97B|nr:ABC transporter substrate-binding protein [Deinococcus sp.]